MPWIYVDAEKGKKGSGIGAEITGDDSEVIGLLQNYTLDMRKEPIYYGDVPIKYGPLDARASLEIMITDIDGWLQGFHKPLIGSG